MDEQSLAEALDRDAVTGKYLTFWTDGQLYGVPIAVVLQIVGVPTITVVPEYPDYAKGFINLRGIITPVIDVRLRFNMTEKDYDEKTCIIVTTLNDRQIGFLVDAVDSVIDIDDDQISAPPTVKSFSAKNYLTGVAQFSEKIALLLDIAKLIDEETIASLGTSETAI